MPAVLDHPSLVDAIETALTAGIAAEVTSSQKPLVDRGQAPKAGGWVAGQPGRGVFRPYVVIVAGDSVPRHPAPTSYPDWASGFSLRSFGGSFDQANWMATLIRRIAPTLKGIQYAAGDWEIIALEWGSLGGPIRNDASDPPLWQVFDSLTYVSAATGL
jgi:hypothetical protein